MQARPAVRLVLALALSASVTPALSLVSPAGATTSGISVAGLARGAAPHTAYLHAGVIHRPDGGTVRVAVPSGSRPSLQLLGHTSAGWAVVRGSDDLLLVTRHATRRVARMPDWGPFTAAWYLNRQGTRVLVAADEDQAGLRLTVLGLDGTHQGSRMFRGYPDVLDFDGDHVVLAGKTTRVWTLSHGLRTLGERGGTFARWDRDLLFVGRTASGPTSLRHPGRAPWTTRMTPVDLSPDGRRVLALDDPDVGGHQRYAVLSRSTGRVLSSWRLPHTVGTAMRWESNRAVLIGVDVKRGQTVLRCRVHGSCKRTLAWSARATQTQVPVTLAFASDGAAYF